MAKRLGIAGCGCGCGGKSGIGEPISIGVAASIAAKKVGAYCKAQPQQCAAVGAQIHQAVGKGIQNGFNWVKERFQAPLNCDRASIFNRAHNDREQKYWEWIDGVMAITSRQPYSALMYMRMKYPVCSREGHSNWYLVWPDDKATNAGRRWWSLYYAEGGNGFNYAKEEMRAADRITDWALVSEMEWTGSFDAEPKNRANAQRAMTAQEAFCLAGGASELDSLKNNALFAGVNCAPPPVVEAKPVPTPAQPAPKPPAPALPPQKQILPPPVQQAVQKEEKKEATSSAMLYVGLAAAAYFALKK
jgi:hypothetical protein